MRPLRHVASISVAVLMFLTVGFSFALAAASAEAGFAVSPYALGFPSSGAIGIAFQPGTNDLYVTAGNGHLFRVPFGSIAPGGAFVAGAAPVDVGQIHGTPSGIAFAADGKLYVARTQGDPANFTSGSGTGDVVEVSPTTGAVLRSLGTVVCADGLAYDPLSGSLIVTTCGIQGMYRISAPAGPTTPIPWAAVYKARGVVVSATGQIYANAPSDAKTNPTTTLPPSTIWRVGTAAFASPQFVGIVAGASGLAFVGALAPNPPFFYVTTETGSIVKLNTLLGTTRPVASGGDPADFTLIGPDGCLYAAMGSEVVQVTKADGTCDLLTAGEEIPTMTLTWTAWDGSSHSSPSPRIGDNVTATATLTAVDAPAPTVSYTIAGVNPGTGTATFVSHSAASRTAIYSITYTGSNVGADTLTANTTVNSIPVVSNPLPVVWRPLGDTTPPIVIPNVVGPGGTASFSCPADGVATHAATIFCGWYVGPAWVTFAISDPESAIISQDIACAGVLVSWTTPPTGENIICTVRTEGGTTTSSVVVNAVQLEPHITVSAKTADNLPYVPGTPTNQNVTVTFTCDAAFQMPFMSCVGGGVNATAGAAGPPALATATVVVTSEGTTTLNGTVTDVPGRSASTSIVVVIDRTAPVVTGTPTPAPTNGWNNTAVLVTWTCADLVSTCTVVGAATQTVTAEGTTILTHTATDVAGNVGTGTVTVKIDRVAPVITASAKTSEGATYIAGITTNLPVTVTFTCSDPGLPGAASGVAPGTCPGPVTFTTSQDGVTSGIATDLAGNPSVAATFGAIVIDNTPPTITGSGTPAPNADGWNTGAVVVAFVCGPDAVSCTPPETATAEGATTVIGTATDAAGNSATATVTVQIDSTKPTVSITPSSGTFHPQVIVQLAATDSRSGVKEIQYALSGATTGTGTFGPSGGSLTITAVGTTTITATSSDKAGNVSDIKTGTVTISATPLTVATTTTVTTRTLRDGRLEATAVVKQSNGQFVPAGNTVTFSVGATTVTAEIGASGTATAIFPGLAPGEHTVTATFTTQLPFLASSAVAIGTAAQATNFVIWGGNPGGVLIGQRVQFWGSDWFKQIADKKSASYQAAGSFKGYAQTMTATTFAATTGKGQRGEDDGDYDEKGSKIKDLPTAEYITVAITDQVAQQGKNVTGSVVGYAVLRVERTKRGSYEERAFGVVVTTN